MSSGLVAFATVDHGPGTAVALSRVYPAGQVICRLSPERPMVITGGTDGT